MNRWLRVGIVALLCLLLDACDMTLYSGLSERDANVMVALLLNHHILASKQYDKANNLTVSVDVKEFAKAVDVLEEAGLPYRKRATVMDVFPDNQLVSSPQQEQAKLLFLKEQKLESMLSHITGVVSAEVSIGEPTKDPATSTAKPSVSVLLTYAQKADPNASLDQAHQLLKQSIVGLDDENISIVMVQALPLDVPSSDSGQGSPRVSAPMFGSKALWSVAALLAVVAVAGTLLWRWSAA